jgi:hypothetical protein
MKHWVAIKQIWFVTCAVGAMVAPIMPTYVAAGVVLVGLILLVGAKDRQSPHLGWSATARRYLRDHHWHPWYRWLGVAGTVLCLSFVGDRQTRGVYLGCLVVYAALHVAVRIRAGGSDAPVGS